MTKYKASIHCVVSGCNMRLLTNVDILITRTLQSGPKCQGSTVDCLSTAGQWIESNNIYDCIQQLLMYYSDCKFL